MASKIRPDEIRGLFNMLFGRPVKIMKGKDLQTGTSDDYVVAVYKNGDDKVMGLCAVDWELATCLAAALSLFPPPAVQRAQKTGKMDDVWWDNLREVFNVSSRMFSGAFSESASLTDLVRSSSTMDKNYRQWLRKGKRMDYSIAIKGYGRGVLAVVGVK